MRRLPGGEGGAPLPRLYRPEEIAEALGCSAWWVKDRARRGLIPHTRVGRAYRFTAAHLAEIVRLHEERPQRSVTGTSPSRAVTSPPAARTRATRSPGPTTASTPGRLRARPPRRTQYETVA
ncbi:helix-turn-helix domain-containing protein [Streptomyces sp. DT2A-34]|uniref:helix-turn-helix domain-containing protein n=1 Tax=Streptomyces sp. DT2A-34 TaxID=3051182 RepID=UPI00265C3B00|nr:helix-turn-helix domain-containing protein [Streptomyces sp. DT2A-34]MDO0913028.1 helix-turn-helix domain-containing protein [Streptomyces sp. DT2A-34]